MPNLAPALPITLATLAFVLGCIVTDVRSRRIPNALSASAVAAGFGLNLLYDGTPGLLTSLAGLFVTSALLFGPFALGGIGGGDVKMMGAVGALLGPRLGLASVLAGMIVGGFVTVAHLARRARLAEKTSAAGGMILAAVQNRSLGPLQLSETDPNAVTLPYAVPLGLGTMIAIAVSTALGT